MALKKPKYIKMESNKETISRLKFIAKIQKGEKINLRAMNVQLDGLFTQITRTISQDNRAKTLLFLQDTITKSFEILKCYQKSKKRSDKIMCANLVDDLRACKNGLLNMKETYLLDIKFCCDIDTMTQMIEAKLIETATFIPPPPPPDEAESGDDI